MRKKTKTGILVTAVLAAIVGAATALVGFGFAPFFLTTSVVGVGIIGAAVGIVGLLTTVGIVVEGAIKRGAAKRTQVNAAQAEYQLVKAKDNTKVMSMAKMKRRDLKLAKSMVYLARNNHSNLYGFRYRAGYSGDRNQARLLKAENELRAWEQMNNVAQIHGSQRHIRKSGTKIQQLNGVIARLRAKTGEASTVNTPRYEATYEMRSHEGMYDGRTFGGFNNSETKNEFVSYINSDKSVELRYGPGSKKDYGYVVEVKSRNNGKLVPVYAGSNAEEEMELFELMLLKDIKRSIEKGDVQFEPLTVNKMHYYSDNKLNKDVEYGSHDRNSEIRTMEELDERIELLEKAIAPSSSIRRRNGYLSRRYEDTAGTTGPEMQA